MTDNPAGTAQTPDDDAVVALTADIEQRLREAMDGVTPGKWKAVVWKHSGGSDTVCIKDSRDREIIAWPGFDGVPCTKAEIRANARFIAAARNNIGALLDTIVSLRSKLEEAEGALGPMVKKIDACNWYWPEHETDSESCCESAQDVVQNAYDWSHEKAGDVVSVARGGVVEVTYCASLPPADDADSDDEFWVEEKTYEAAALKVAEEQSRRTLASLREADHA